jgi:biopolymer transport protein ExbB/TolQ
LTKKKKKQCLFGTVGALLIAGIASIPSDVYIYFIDEQVKKTDATIDFLKSLTALAKVAMGLVVAVVSLIIYKVVK